ncbi:MAG: SDR family oxidoreductase [Actinomycetota bacterium]
MPVVVVGASGLIGTRAVAALSRTSPQVRAYVRSRDAAAALSAAGAKVAVGWAGDVDNLATVMAGAHTVVHLIGGLDLPSDDEFRAANLDSVRVAVDAARRAKVERFVFISYPGADPDSPNAYLRYKGMAERAVSDSGMAFAIIRSTHVYGTGSRWLDAVRAEARRRPPVVIGSGKQIVAPVLAEDVAATIVAADDRAELRSGTWGLEGPDRLTADELADVLGARGRRKVHVGAGTATALARMMGRRVSRTTLEVLASDSLSDAPDAAGEFGVSLTAFRAWIAAQTAREPAGRPE